MCVSAVLGIFHSFAGLVSEAAPSGFLSLMVQIRGGRNPVFFFEIIAALCQLVCEATHLENGPTLQGGLRKLWEASLMNCSSF